MLRLSRVPYLALILASFGLGAVVAGAAAESLVRAYEEGRGAGVPAWTRAAAFALLAVELLAVAGRLRDLGRPAWWALLLLAGVGGLWLAVPAEAGAALFVVWYAALAALGLIPGRRGSDPRGVPAS